MEKRNNLTVIFVYRPTSTYAMNVLLGALESVFDSKEFEILCIRDPHDVRSAVEELLVQERKVLVCWSFYSPNFNDIASELNAMKKDNANPNVIHLAGGVHATAEPGQTLAAGFDFVAVGEGEKTITDFISRLIGSEQLYQTKGIAYLNDSGQTISNGSGERIDLNDFPPFAPKHRKFNPIEITRGCIYACKFCQTPFMFKAKFRHRTVENICHYVRIMKDHGLTDIRFITPTSLSYGSDDESVRIDRIEELLSSVRETLGGSGRIFFGTFPSELRPEHVTLEALRVLKKYVANDNLIIGGQAGSQSVLDHSKRGHSVESIVQAVRLSLETGFVPKVDFIFGLPGETEADVVESLTLADQLSEMGARVHGHTFMPLPGTPFKDALPGQISESTLRRLHRLESRGTLYGNWKQQESIAQDLREMRKKKVSYAKVGS